jgi:DNA repair protein RecN (Recombination protein N)
MLTTLRIKNLALVSDLTLELQAGFNAITGETGAGKSIIIGALNLVLGERADRTLIRAGCDSCTVEAVLDVTQLRAPLKQFLDENGLEPCESGELVLKRTFTAAGANRQFVNGTPTALNTLAAIGAWLVDMHGPHEHQSLLHPGRQLAILDTYGGLEALREDFAVLVRRRAALQAGKAALIVDERTYAQQLDLLRHQVNEIAGAKLQADDQARVETDYQRASNAAKLQQLAQAALALLGEDEHGMLTQAGLVGRQLQELQRTDASAAPLSALHDQAVAAIRELQAELSRYADHVEVDPGRLAELQERLDLLNSLRRKYGSTLADVIAFGEQARQKLQHLENRDAELQRLNQLLAEVETAMAGVGRKLSDQRRKLAPQLGRAVEKELADLALEQSRFSVAVSTETDLAKFNPQPPLSGLDTVEFQFAPNPGEPARPLRAIASSGEMSRVMLALKTVLAAEDEVPVLVFDEIDVNIGGATAARVGEKMRQIARQRQVLCITHLPAVAAAAPAHYVVTKQIAEGRTTSGILLLDRKARIEEITRMLGGRTPAAREHAEALLRT